MIEKGICVLCNNPADEVHWACIYCREFVSDVIVRDIDTVTEEYTQGRLTTKQYAFYLAGVRDVRDVNYLCDLYLPDTEKGR
jgi:hypothetical protein